MTFWFFLVPVLLFSVLYAVTGWSISFFLAAAIVLAFLVIIGRYAGRRQ